MIGFEPSPAYLLEALRDVEDPELPVSIVDMGLIVDLQHRDGIVEVAITFTAMGCPAMDMIIDDVRERRAWTVDQQVLIDFLRSPEMREVTAVTPQKEWTEAHAD